ncbi:hypothetical protein H4R33_000095 [Dimargaris cristalligena]|nr:hypothetical protein H4R33_000095 [Dimargaris cristalligena]
MAFQYSTNYYTPDILAERLGSMFVSSPAHAAVTPDTLYTSGHNAEGFAPYQVDDSLPESYSPRRRRNGMCDLNDSVRNFFAAGASDSK